MMMRRIVAGLVIAAAAAAFLTAYVRFFLEAEERLDSPDLERRALLSAPSWASYQEDIKAQIGAAPVAQWSGHPVEARREGDRVHVRFRLEGPWAERSAVIPVLVRDPFGHEHRYEQYSLQPPDVVYTFELEGESAGAPVPWIMVKYPHHEDRLPLDANGQWRSER